MNGSISNSYSSGSAGHAVPAPPSPVNLEMNRLRSAGEEVHSLLDRLEERLSQVLRPVPPHPVGDDKGKPLHESPLHGALISQADLVASAGSRIVSMLDRLTL